MAVKVLVVDDNPVSRELVREVLENPDRTILEAGNGEEALNAISGEMPDLVLLDIQLPVFDGYEVLRRIRSDPKTRRIPVIALTAYAMQQDRDRAMESGFDAYMTKPINASVLRSEIDRFLQTRDWKQQS